MIDMILNLLLVIQITYSVYKILSYIFMNYSDWNRGESYQEKYRESKWFSMEIRGYNMEFLKKS